MLTVVFAVLAGTVLGLAAPATIERIPAGRFPTPRELVRPNGAVDWAIVIVIAGTWGVLAGAVGSEPELAAYLYLGWVGVVLAVIDICCRRLPDLLVFPSYPIALVLLGTAAAFDGMAEPLIRALAGGLALAALYYGIAFVSAGGLGLGDVKLGGLLGLYLGWVGWTALALATLLAFVVAAAAAAGLIGTRRAGRSSRIPFGPFLLAGALISLALSA